MRSSSRSLRSRSRSRCRATYPPGRRRLGRTCCSRARSRSARPTASASCRARCALGARPTRFSKRRRGRARRSSSSACRAARGSARRSSSSSSTRRAASCSPRLRRRRSRPMSAGEPTRVQPEVDRGLDLKRAVVGRPLASDELEETLLRKLIALPIFASDPLSSVAYATEAAMVVLLAAGVAALHLVLPISVAISVLLAIVVLSYRQTVRAYESSGGAYIVAKENLGTLPSLVAAAALLTDYVLTVAVSVAAGVFAISSAAPSLAAYRVQLCLAFIVLLTFANLRGVKEAGIAFALPTYSFVAVLYVMIGTGLARCAVGSCPQAVVPHPLPAGAGAVGVFLVLKAFASGSAALTGVEAISNGVSAFRPPQARNAARTLTAMALIAITLFLGVSFLAVHMHARPSGSVSVLSEIARATFPTGSAGSFLFYVIQVLTFAILVLAANTSFQGFPRLGALLARHRFFPRQFVNLGDR